MCRHALLLNNFERRVLRIENTTTTVHSRSTCRNTIMVLLFIARFVRFYLQGALIWLGVYKKLSPVEY